MIRVSGSQSFKIAGSLAEKPPEDPESHKSYFTQLVAQDGEKIDQVLMTYFKEGHSFTGDQTVEISCHGNPLIVNQITQKLLEKGCRSAERGEFSFRAYYNGKLDLVQAESIHGLVTSPVKKGSESFLGQLEGKLSQKFQQLQDALISAMAHLEASIDFVEEDIETAEFKQVTDVLRPAVDQVQDLVKSYDVGKNLSENPKILILGPANAGKSSLFNRIVESERAIVTDIPGTTRDLVSEQRFLGNLSVEFLDSAGLRDSSDVVENLGIQKSLDQVSRADVIFYVVDVANLPSSSVSPKLPLEKTLFILNKVDLLVDRQQRDSVLEKFINTNKIDLSMDRFCFVSAVKNEGINQVLHQTSDLLESESSDGESLLITQARHYQHLSNLEKFLGEAIQLLENQQSPDLISQELSMGLSELHQLLGKEYDDEVLDKIFSDFCIGK